MQKPLHIYSLIMKKMGEFVNITFSEIYDAIPRKYFRNNIFGKNRTYYKIVISYKASYIYHDKIGNGKRIYTSFQISLKKFLRGNILYTRATNFVV